MSETPAAPPTDEELAELERLATPEANWCREFPHMAGRRGALFLAIPTLISEIRRLRAEDENSPFGPAPSAAESAGGEEGRGG